MKQKSDDKDEKVKAAIEGAQQIVNSIPNLDPELKSAAFEKAFDSLIGQNHTKNLLEEPKPAHSAQPKTDSHLEKIITSPFDLSKYPQAQSASTALDNALIVLKIAKDEFGIDGLTTPEIVTVLKEKLRRPLRIEAISMALKSAGSKVDRVRKFANGVWTYEYRLMSEGEKFLETRFASSREKNTQ